MEKDIARYQIQESNPGPIRKPAALLGLLGGFYRDDDQLQLEHRKTLRVDDTAMCLIAITHMLETLASIKSVVVDGCSRGFVIDRLKNELAHALCHCHGAHSLDRGF